MPADAQPERGLLILPRRGERYREDFAIVADAVRRLDPGIRVCVSHEETETEAAAEALAGLATVVVSFDGNRAIPLPAHRRFVCRHIIKTAQLRQYAEARIPYPMSAAFSWGMNLDPQRWGPLLVMKPLDPHVTSRGIVHLIPTSVLGQLKPAHFAPGHPIHSTPMLLQAFIDTGEYPSHYRVLMLFGEPLYACEHVMVSPRPPLDAPVEQLLKANIATNGGERRRRLFDDADVIAFARRMAKALPAIPLQGIDVMRHHASGQLFAIENNTGGNTWHFSSGMGEELREQISRDALIAQFGAFDRAAEALVETTRRVTAGV
jgi:hypothetical protein